MLSVENIQTTIEVPTSNETCWNVVESVKRVKKILKESPDEKRDTPVESRATQRYVKSERRETVDINEIDRSRGIPSLDLVNTWIDSENNEFLWNTKSKLFKMMLKKLKQGEYSYAYDVTNFTNYLSEASNGFFRLVVDHQDKRTKKIITMYDWNSGVINDATCKREHCYIVAVGDIPVKGYNWAETCEEKYRSIKENNIDTNPENPEMITKKGFSILRRHATQDLVTVFMKLNFFQDYEHAKSFIIHNTNGYVTFISKERKDETVPDETEHELL